MNSAGIGKASSHIKGFTLLEILVALTVASIALAVLVQGLSYYVNQFIHLKEKAIAQTIVTSELAHKSLDYDYVMPELVERGGSQWQLQYEEKNFAFRDLKGIKQITVTVRSSEDEPIFTTSAIIYAPELSK